jgi:murein DD-endopeptidase MepM/ murein hydrolase activator NlpD
VEKTEAFQNLAKSVRKHWKKSLLPIGLLAVFFIGNEISDNKLGSASIHEAGEVKLGSFPIVAPTLKWGFAIDTFTVEENVIENNQFFGDILNQNGMEYSAIEEMVQSAKDVFDVRNWRVGKPFFFLKKDETSKPDFLVYEPSVFVYYVFDLNKKTCERVERPITTQSKKSAGVIESSLWNAMIDGGMSYELADKMEDALQWSVDFHHTQKGDQFKLLYDEQIIDGEVVGIGNLHAALYKSGDTEFQAVYFEDKEHPGFYDLEGRPMNKGFLKAPVKFSRISSHYNPKRFHPILKRVRPHLGTDYAAPYGTPILAIGDGVVLEATRRGGNGNFVKIKHNETYSTQYLHMQKFAQGIRPGVHVKQGQTIGYVGSTGLATGPHVCFRFWKNGKQVNHLNLSFPPPEPLPSEVMPEFEKVRDGYLEQLNALPFAELSDDKEDKENP